jgi:hypothetical protein
VGSVLGRLDPVENQFGQPVEQRVSLIVPANHNIHPD